ncbi:MAG: hypothetical protein AB4426_28270 [Xenococcaceae cyanobacterium]
MSFVDFLRERNFAPPGLIDEYESSTKEQKIQTLEALLELLGKPKPGGLTVDPTVALALAFELQELTKQPNPIGNEADGILTSLEASIKKDNLEIYYPEKVFKEDAEYCVAVLFGEDEEGQWDVEGSSRKSRFNALAKAYYFNCRYYQKGK